MKKKVLLTIGLVLLIGIKLYFGYYLIHRLVLYPYDKMIALITILLTVTIIDIIINIMLIVYLWKANICFEIKDKYEQWKIDKEKNKQRKKELKRQKLEEKIKKL